MTNMPIVERLPWVARKGIPEAALPGIGEGHGLRRYLGLLGLDNDIECLVVNVYLIGCFQAKSFEPPIQLPKNKQRHTRDLHTHDEDNLPSQA